MKSAMTNGTVTSGAVTGESRTLTVYYGGGKNIEIAVPPTAPVVSVEPADPSVLKPGAKVFTVAAENSGKLDGKWHLVGKDG